MKNKYILTPLFTLFLLVAVAFITVQPATAEEPAPVTLTGTVTAIDDLALSIEVETAEDTLVTVFLPTGFDLATLSIGDGVQVTGMPNEDGSIAATEVLILTEGVEVTGTVTAIDELALSLTLFTAEETSVAVFLPAGFDLTTLSVADEIKVAGTANEDGSVNALDIVILYEAVEVTGTGAVTAMDPLGQTFIVDIGGTLYTFVPPTGFDWTSITVGDSVDISGMQRQDGIVMLVSLTVTSEGEEEDGELSESHYCTTDEVHPFGGRLAEHYGVDYAILKGWFCDGYGWGQILLALKTGQITGSDPSALLSERKNGSGWGEIWQELKLIGKDKDARPPEATDADGDGKPGKHGNPHDTEGDVEEEDEGKGPPEDHGKPADEDGDGRPDHPTPPGHSHRKP